MHDDAFGVGPDDQIPDALWVQMMRVFPPPKARKQDGWPRMDDRQAMTAILSVLRTGCQWKALPRRLGAASTVHDRFQEWRGGPGVRAALAGWVADVRDPERPGVGVAGDGRRDDQGTAWGGNRWAKTQPIAASSGPNGAG
jgi:hypothetical protein